MYTVNNKLFTNFDHLVDINGLLTLKPQISAFIALNGYRINPTKFSTDNFLTPNLLGITDLQIEAKQHPEKFGNPDIVNDLLLNDQFGSYIIFEQDVVHNVNSFVLRYPMNYKLKHLAKECCRIPEDTKFNFFYNWLDNQHIFSDYGSVSFFINYPGSFTPIHKDYPRVDEANSDEFIWIKFNQHKQFFLYNNNTEEKIYAPGYCNWFNTGNWHGSDPVTQASYTLRVDGIFSDEFKSKI